MNKIELNSPKKSFFVTIAALLLLNLTISCKNEVAQWRGNDRKGIYNETNLLNAWPENGPELLWAFEGIGLGYASPAVLNDNIFVNGEKEGNSFLFAFDLKGNLIWKSPNGKEFMGSGYSSRYPGSRSTPTVVGKLVYTTSGEGRIACFEAKTGVEKWAVDIIKDLNGRNSDFGYSESVAIDDHKLYCFTGGNKLNMAAIDRFTGEKIWTSEALKDTFSYCSPILVELPKRKILITTSRHYLYAVDCENGKLLGSYELEGIEWDGEHCNTPIYDDGYIYFIVNDKKGKGAIKLKISDDGENLTEVWHNKKIRNNFHGYVKVGNKLFTTIKGNWLKSIELDKGRVADSLKAATGSIIFADNKFINYGTNGTINLIDYQQKNLKITGNLKIDKGSSHHFAHPVLDNGIMYIRHGDTLMAYKIK